MSAYEALQAAQAAQVEVKLEGDQLKLKAPRRPPDQLLKLLEVNKRGILALLRPDHADWTVDDWKAFYSERLAVAERNYPKPEAEFIALLDTADRWMAVNPCQISYPADCIHCKNPVSPDERVTVSGANGNTGSLHAGCAARWRAIRKLHARAVVARLID